MLVRLHRLVFIAMQIDFTRKIKSVDHLYRTLGISRYSSIFDIECSLTYLTILRL